MVEEHCHARPDPHLSPEGPHPLRRAEDRAEVEIRDRIFERWLATFAQESPRVALMVALDEYKRQLGLLAIKRFGMGSL